MPNGGDLIIKRDLELADNKRTVDAILLASALDVGAEAFLTNDVKLAQFKDLKILVLKNCL